MVNLATEITDDLMHDFVSIITSFVQGFILFGGGLVKLNALSNVYRRMSATSRKTRN